MRTTTCLFLILLWAGTASAQETEVARERFRLNGYLKDLQTIYLFNESFPELGSNGFQLVDTFLQDNLIHNRLNFWWYASKHFTFKADLRTRAFFGDLVRATPDFAGIVDNANNDYFDLSLVLADNPSFVLHSMIDRLYLEYVNEKWEIRLGRQRVNWGIGTVWNPNDIFNAFNFTDFDYEERPGSDVLRVKRYTGFASSIEVVGRVFDTWDEAIIAGLWKFHTGSYDIQVLGGLVRRDLALGAGWAGNLGNAGLKGELTYFHPLDNWFDGYDEASESFALTVGVDYSFSNSLYLNTGFLYNSNGAGGVSSSELFGFELSAKNLYPYRYGVFGQVSYPFTPLISGGLALIYSPVRVHALFLNPTFTYSLATNWDLDMVGQLSFSKEPKRGYVSPVQALFVRWKWSF